VDDAALNVGGPATTVRVAGFSKRYGRRTAVHDVTFSLGPGEIFGLVGPDGAGKSTVMKAVAGVLSFDGGTIDVLGVRIDSERAAERVKGRMGFMPQGLGLNLYPNLSIEENVDFFARLRGVTWEDLASRKRALLGMTRLERFRDRPMKHLSGGMKQKLGLVCTLIHEPDVVILDEPTTGVDPVSRRDFWHVLAELLHERNVSALVSTAYLDEASRFHRVSLLYEGREIAGGDPRDLPRLSPGTLVVAEVPEGRQLAALERLRTRFEQVDVLGTTVRVMVDGQDAEAAAARVRGALDGVEPAAVHVAEADLEDVLVALLRKDGVAVQEAPVAAGSSAAATRRDGEAIEAVDLTRDFDGFRAVDRVTFRVGRGDIFGLLGANGAGKTTVIKMLTGILPPSSGSGHVAGVDMRRAGAAIKRRIGYMSQAFSLYTDLSVSENIELYAGIYGLGRRETRERLAWIADLGGLHEHLGAQAGSLPMGLRQRLALGCALVHHPEVLFLDEPTSGVDPVGRRRFWDILFRLSREEGVAILVTTHFMSEAEHCDRLALMFAGRIVADAPPEELKRDAERDAGTLLELTVDPPGGAMAALRASGFESAALYGRRLHLFSHDPRGDARRARDVLAAAHVEVGDVRPRPFSMEDVFVYRVTSLEQSQPGAAP
jgi:ABC-2 type transport system ATP-binding protein